MNNQQFGFTLIEMLVTIIIVTIIASLAIPSYTDYSQKQEANAVFSQIRNVFSEARSTSLVSNQSITFCGSSTGSQCDGQWDKGVLSFTDNSKPGVIETTDKIIRYTPLALKHGTLRFVGLNKEHIRFTMLTGLTLGFNGTFTYCQHNNIKNARAIILSKVSNLRLGGDSNHDGIYEDASNKNLVCPN